MAFTYKKLWKMLVDRDMKKKDLARVAGLSSFTITKLAKGQNVTTDTWERICKALGCKIQDITEFIPE